ncbi:MAG: hypothetical protein JOY72_06615 [Actinobacteria bacterium]|nr:hypothetical protein [Actinomycetota bacterium]
MTAREVESVEHEVTELTRRAACQLAIGCAGLIAAVVASVVFNQLAIPLLVAGLAVGARGLVADVDARVRVAHPSVPTEPKTW